MWGISNSRDTIFLVTAYFPTSASLPRELAPQGIKPFDFTKNCSRTESTVTCTAVYQAIFVSSNQAKYVCYRVIETGELACTCNTSMLDFGVHMECKAAVLGLSFFM